MLEHPKALSTHHSYGSKNLKDITMDNQQETNNYYFFNKKIILISLNKKKYFNNITSNFNKIKK
jgi:hypothetical protein